MRFLSIELCNPLDVPFLQMVTFAETAIVVYRLTRACLGKQTAVFSFRLKETNGSLTFPYSDCSK
jgi:hypothetical protein